MHSWYKLVIAGLLCILSNSLFAQKSTIIGRVTSATDGQPIELVTIYIEGTNHVTESNENGVYRIDIPPDSTVTLVFTRIGFEELKTLVGPLKKGKRARMDVEMNAQGAEIEIEVKGRQVEEAAIIKQNVEELKLLPTTTGNFESVLPHIALGASSGSGGELTSQYNVRGGNYDENLVYVNDFEIYRPQLIRNGQQEGLTFANIDMIRDIKFSSGGFEAKYGDKLSSVLDISYKRPDSSKYSLGFSLLGASAHLEGSVNRKKDAYQKFRYLVGARYKTTKYLLGSLQLTGEYTPNFVDVQGYFTYDLNRNWQLGYLTNFNRSEYQFLPDERRTATGLIDFALQLFAVFEGQEQDRFTTTMNGLSLTYIPERDRNPMFLKFLVSHQTSDEKETFDLLGAYRLSVIETDFTSESAGEEILTIGTGLQHQYARNFLFSNVSLLGHKGGIEYGSGADNHFVQWGVNARYESITDRINEWERLDSAGYSLPYDPAAVRIKYQLKSQNELSSTRFQGYIQDTWTKLTENYEMRFSYGLRLGYWTLNKELLWAPRAQILYKPLQWKRDISLKFAGGFYHQPAFYRELRRTTGIVNPDILAQKSAHVVAGWTWDFEIGDKNPTPVRFISEIYFKYLWDLVTYEIENVRIKYVGENNAKGYVMGWDMRFNGEFVPGAESWVNLSLLRAREKILGIDHLRREVGEAEGKVVKDVPRPSDQLLQLSLFFQDYLPKNENFKVHVNLTVGTGLPFGILGNNEIHRNTYRFPAYHRVDIGFSFLLWNEIWKTRKPKHLLRFTKNTWMSLEVFNLMKILNVASNTWIKSIYNVQYAIPNYLTTRRINLRFKIDF